MVKEGRYEEAEQQLKYVLDLKLRYWSDDYTRIGNTYGNLGVAYKELFQFEEALTHMTKLKNCLKKYDPNHLSIGSHH